jgi:hypothetical protein
MKHKSFIYSLALAVFFGSSILVSPMTIMAHDGHDHGVVLGENDSTPSATLLDSQGTRQTHEAEITKLRQQYLGEVEAYRRSEQNFRVLKQQYLNLKTLKSLEDATAGTKAAMYERTRVLTTYTEIIYFTLLDTGGINLVYKNAQITELENRVDDLRAHLEKISASTSRDDVNQLRDDFALLQPELENTAYRSMSLISMGKLQTIYDQALIILKDLDSQLLEATVSAIKKTELERAFFETQRSLNLVKADIDEVDKYYADQDELFNKGDYSNILADLGTVYSQLSQNLSYLEELLRL